MAAMVRLEQVGKRYRVGGQHIEVLSGLDLEVAKGDFVALMGPSGSGKTTLLNLIGGLDCPTSGNVVVAGERISELSGSRLAHWRSVNIGFVFQHYNLMPMLNVERNVELPLLLTSLNKAQRMRNARAALTAVGLEGRFRHRPTQLSGGQAQRVAIARALVADPSLLICDEPTGDLDRETADDILGLLRTLNREFGTTIVMVTHDSKAAGFSDHTVYLDKGRLVGTFALPMTAEDDI